MLVGIPEEIKEYEYRVAIIPAGVRALIQGGHKVMIEKNAGLEAGIPDEEYQKAGAIIMDKREEIFSSAQMILKVKEPLPEEYPLLRERQSLFTYLHLAAAPELANVLLEKGIIAIAYETVQQDNGFLPLLAPMSKIAGKLSVQEGARYLEKMEGGKGILLGGIPGVNPGKVSIIGAGTSGMNAAKMAVGMGADTTVLDINHEKLSYLDDIFGNKIKTLAYNIDNLWESVIKADLLIGAVLIAGARAPKLVTKDMVSQMKKGSVILDISIDQGGCIETSRPTYLANPTYLLEGVIHSCVPNMPSAVAATSTYALANSTLPYILALTNKGYKKALEEDPALAKGLNIIDGKITHKAISDDLGYKYYPVQKILNLFD